MLKRFRTGTARTQTTRFIDQSQATHRLQLDILPDSVAINNRISAAIDSARQVAFDWNIVTDKLYLSGVLAESFKGVLLDSTEKWTSRALLGLFHDDDVAAFRVKLHAALKPDANGEGVIHNVELRLKHASREWRWVEMHAKVVERDEADRALRIVGTISDIDERKRVEKKIDRLRDLYIALSQTNQAIVRINKRDALFREICRIAVTHGRFHLAWIGIVDPSNQRVAPVASFGHNSHLLNDIVISVDESLPEGRDGIGKAIRTNSPDICNDFFDAEDLQPWRQAAADSGFQALATFPFLKEGTPFGAFSVYATEKNFFDEQAINLLAEMAGDISFAIDNFEREARREAAEHALAESEKLKSSILTSALDCIISTDAQGVILTFNPAAESTFGHAAEEVIGKELAGVIVQEEWRERHRRGIANFVRTRHATILNRRIEQTAIRADGSVFPIELAVIPSETRDGLIFTAFIRDISALKHTQEVLKDLALRYRQLVELSPEPIVVHRNGKLVLLNKAAVRLLGITDASAVLGREVLNFIHPDFHASSRSRHPVIESDMSDVPFIDEIWLHEDGTPFPAEVATTNLNYDGLPAVQVVVRDLTIRKRAEALQVGQNRILNMIATGIALPDILAEVARFVESQSQNGLCSVSLANTGATTLTTAAAPSLPPAFLQSIETLPIGPSSGACGTAAFRCSSVIITDIASDPLCVDFIDLCNEHKIKGVSSWPIFGKDRKVLGTIALYFPTGTSPSQRELQLFDIATNLAGIAIESRESEERIRFLAHYDGLTSLPNRFLFKEFLDRALHNAQRNNQRFAVFFLDLDRFKNINDTFGHDAGDWTLCEITSRFQSILRKTDTIARMGGDEFYILVEDLPVARDAADVAQKLLDEAARPFFIKNQECHLTASIGIVVYPDDGTDQQTLLKNSDIAMYRAKASGKNAYEFYSASKDDHTAEKLGSESRLRRAIENKEFVLHYQPKIDLKTGQITSVEALARWENPQQGLLSPVSFIGLAEETGMIVSLGKQLLDIAGKDWMKLRDNGLTPLRIAVNLSARQLKDNHLLEDIEKLIERTDPSWLDLEITESMMMHNPEQAVEIMNQLVAMGVRLSIDDFGTGYSSLAYLKRFPVHSIKIDRSFVQDIPGDANDTAITKAIIAMGHSLGLAVVAEGVETIEQEAALQQFGCDEYQGFYFCRPIPFDELATLLRSKNQAISHADLAKVMQRAIVESDPDAH